MKVMKVVSSVVWAVCSLLCFALAAQNLIEFIAQDSQTLVVNALVFVLAADMLSRWSKEAWSEK